MINIAVLFPFRKEQDNSEVGQPPLIMHDNNSLPPQKNKISIPLIGK